MTYPTTPPDQVGKPCYTCAHLYDVAPLGHASCARERDQGHMSVQSVPERGCVYWQRDPARPAISTREEWVALHGSGLTGFSERGEKQFRPPMTAEQARQAARDGDAAALAWEVARLHDVERRLVDALLHISAQIEVQQFRDDIILLRKLLAKEPAVAAHLEQR